MRDLLVPNVSKLFALFAKFAFGSCVKLCKLLRAKSEPTMTTKKGPICKLVACELALASSLSELKRKSLGSERVRLSERVEIESPSLVCS